MNPNTIKHLDRFAGIPVCFVLTVYDRLKALFVGGATSQIERPRNILFIKLIEQGASVLAYPAFKKAQELAGPANLYFCVFKENRPIMDVLGVIPAENIFEIRRDSIGVFLVDLLRFFLWARRIGIDATVDMEFFSRASAIIAYLTGARRRVGYHRFTSELPYRGRLMTHNIQYNPYLHVAHAYLLSVEALVSDTDEIPMPKTLYQERELPLPEFVPTNGERARIEAFFAGKNGRPRILINPNAGDMLPLRKWSPEKFGELTARILTSYEDATIVITGAPSEASAAEHLRRKAGSDRVVNLAGKTSLRELMALYCASDALITNDSGPGHFAAMTPLRTIVLFGPETPELFGPLGGNVHIVRIPLACSPCVSVLNHRFSPCTRNRCMELISVEAVFGTLQKVLDGTGSARR